MYDPRFCSAAVFAPDGKTLKKSILGKFAGLGWRKRDQWRSADFRCFHLCAPPVDFSPWKMGAGNRDDVSVRFDVRWANQAEMLAVAAVAFIGEAPVDLTASVTISAPKGREFNLGVGQDVTRLSVSASNSDLGAPSARLLAPWAGCKSCVYSEVRAVNEVSLTSWTVEELCERLRGLPRYCLKLRGVEGEQFARAAGAVAEEVVGKVAFATCAVNMNHTRCRELFPLVRTRVPEYTFSIFTASYAEAFDPFVRPAAADAGETVRYPLVNCERPQLDKDGRKDIQIDIVHRPQGDCYIDLQAFQYKPEDDTVVRQTLEEAIAPLDVKAEIWEGDPFLRWH